MSVLAESCSADGPDGLHGVVEQELMEVVVSGVGRVGAARGPGVSTCTPILDTLGPSLTAGGAWGGSGKKLIFGCTVATVASEC